MRVVIQRVSQASLVANGSDRGSIKTGLVILLGIEEADTTEDVQWLSAKVADLRIFSDEQGKMNLSVKEVSGSLMLVSQFTLHASTKKGNRPSFIQAARPDKAIPLYEAFIEKLKETGLPFVTGIFGADMQVSLVNDGPVTICMDSRNRE
jgi:D-tyrosyl-tRNA(Tyr) deacylase